MHSSPSVQRQQTVAALAASPQIAMLEPAARRFVQSLRLIALHQRLGRDPGPELAVRLSSVEIAAKSIYLANVLASVWPETIQTLRFGCSLLSHDELTIGACFDAAARDEREPFARSLAGLIRPDRMHRVWAAMLLLCNAEKSTA